MANFFFWALTGGGVVGTALSTFIWWPTGIAASLAAFCFGANRLMD